MNERDDRENSTQSLRIGVTLGGLYSSLVVLSGSGMASLLAVGRTLPSPHDIEARLLISACLSASRFQDLFASIL